MAYTEKAHDLIKWIEKSMKRKNFLKCIDIFKFNIDFENNNVSIEIV
jgi:hypothetical protein